MNEWVNNRLSDLWNEWQPEWQPEWQMDWLTDWNTHRQEQSVFEVGVVLGALLTAVGPISVLRHLLVAFGRRACLHEEKETTSFSDAKWHNKQPCNNNNTISIGRQVSPERVGVKLAGFLQMFTVARRGRIAVSWQTKCNHHGTIAMTSVFLPYNTHAYSPDTCSFLCEQTGWFLSLWSSPAEDDTNNGRLRLIIHPIHPVFSLEWCIPVSNWYEPESPTKYQMHDLYNLTNVVD